MSTHRPGLSIALPLVLLLCAPAQAHKLLAKYQVLPGARVQVESYFDTDDSPPGASVKVHRSGGALLCEGKLDTQGLYVFSFTEPEDLRVVVKDHTGHRAEVSIPGKELTRAVAADAAALLIPPAPFVPLTIAAARAAIGQPEETTPARLPDRGHGPPWGKLLLGAGILLGLGALAVVVQKVRAR